MKGATDYQLNLTVDVMVKCAGLTDHETAVCEQKAQHAAHTAAAEYVRGVLEPKRPARLVDLKGYRRKAARLGISLVEYERRYLQPS